MREAIGGTWLMGIVIFFIVLFSGYLAISVNYSRAFRVKNEIVGIIEKHRGHNMCAQREIESRLNEIGYFVYSSCNIPFISNIDTAGQQWRGFQERTPGSATYRYCLRETNECDPTITGSCAHVTMPRMFFTVGVFFRIDFPALRNVFTFTVTGETKPINIPRAGHDESTC